MKDFSRKYEKALTRSVIHIFNSLFGDNEIQETYKTQTQKNDAKVWIEITGSFFGEVIITLRPETLKGLIRLFHPRIKDSSLSRHKNDVTGEMANLITGTFANQLQYLNHNIRLSPPEFDEDPITMKALFNTISCSFISSFGGFDVDLYYKDE